MKPLKAICTATVLALVLSIPAYAGDINSPGAPHPHSQGQTTEPVTSDPNTALSDTDTPGFTELLLALWNLF